MCKSIPQEQFPWMAWLLRKLSSKEEPADDQLFNNAANQGWLTWQEHGFWRVCGAWAKGLPTNKAIVEHILTVDDAAHFAMAMGELSSGVNGFPLDACSKALNESPGFQKSDAVFQRIGELAKKNYPSVECNLDTLKVAQFINSCQLDYDSFQMVSSFTDYPRFLKPLRRYGLSYGMYIAYMLNFKAFGLWLSRQSDPALIVPTLSQFSILFYLADQKTVVGLLNSRHPFLQLNGIMALHAYRDKGTTCDWHYPLEQAFAIVDKTELSIEDFAWTTFSRFNEFEGLCGRAKGVFEYQVKQGPELSEKAKESKERYEKIVASMEDELSVFTNHFPKNGINEKQASYVLGVTRGRLGLPLRVAEKLPEKTKKTLVKAIFKRFHSQTGIFKLASETEHYSLPYRWKQRVNYSARAFVQYHAGKNIGRKFGSLAKPVEDALVPNMLEPYLYYRRHHKWMHVFGRLGLLYFYTIEIAKTSDLETEKGGSFLIQHMVKQTLILFLHYSGEYFTSLYDVLSLRVANLFEGKVKKDTLEELKAFVDHPRGYSITKLLLVWTLPELFEGYKNKVMHLFRIFDLLPPDEDGILERFSAYANIMDRALVAAHRMKDLSLSNELVADWEKRFSVWKPVVGSKWLLAPHWQQKALSGDNEGYTWLCGLPELSNCLCRRYCDEMYIKHRGANKDNTKI